MCYLFYKSVFQAHKDNLSLAYAEHQRRERKIAKNWPGTVRALYLYRCRKMLRQFRCCSKCFNFEMDRGSYFARIRLYDWDGSK